MDEANQAEEQTVPAPGFFASVLQQVGHLESVHLIGGKMIGKCTVEAVGHDAFILKTAAGTHLVPFSSIVEARLSWDQKHVEAMKRAMQPRPFRIG